MLKVLEPGGYFGKTIPRYNGAGLAIAETDFATDLVIPRHEHVNAFFCFVLGGRATRAWPGREGEEAPMSLTFFPAAMPHENYWNGPGAEGERRVKSSLRVLPAQRSSGDTREHRNPSVSDAT